MNCRLLVISFLLILPGILSGQPDFVLLRATGNSIDSLPEMLMVPDTAQVYQSTHYAIGNSFMGEAIKLYHLAQRYLINQGIVTIAEPAYLAITKHQGGFAKTGFVLTANGQQEHKPNVHYVDLTESNLRAPLDRLQSISQLYPHELMHIMFKMLSERKDRADHSFNVNMHFFSVITDYNTAFNEGFAEHMENISRLNESNDSIRNGLEKQVQVLESYLSDRGQGFKKDIQWPLRLDYYKASMLIWYSQFEDYKRYVYARRDEETFIRPTSVSNLHDAITLRNSGIENPGLKKKNLVQCMASEGFVSTFLTHLAESSLPEMYREPAFYKQFLNDTTQGVIPKQTFSPLENLFLKYFHVLHHHVRYAKSERAQLVDFIDGYRQEFPDEAPLLLSIFKDLAGQDFSTELPLPLWFLVRDYQHPALVMDAFGGLTVPVYTFDINMAEVEDLMTLPEVSRTEAAAIIDYRNDNGLFYSSEDVFSIPDLKQSVRETLQKNVMDKTYFDSLDEENLSIARLITAPLLHLLKMSLIYFLCILGFIYYRHPKNSNLANMIATMIKYFFLMLFFVLMGLVTVMINGNTMFLFLIVAAIYTIVTFIILRKRKQVLLRNYLITGVMMAIVLYSIS